MPNEEACLTRARLCETRPTRILLRSQSRARACKRCWGRTRQRSLPKQKPPFPGRYLVNVRLISSTHQSSSITSTTGSGRHTGIHAICGFISMKETISPINPCHAQIKTDTTITHPKSSIEAGFGNRKAFLGAFSLWGRAEAAAAGEVGVCSGIVSFRIQILFGSSSCVESHHYQCQWLQRAQTCATVHLLIDGTRAKSLRRKPEQVEACLISALCQ